MDDPTQLRFSQDPTIKQSQRLMASAEMRQAFRLLQTPVVELIQVIQQELDQNPILTFGEEDLDYPDLNLEALKREVHELPNDVNMPPEKELVFDENDYRIMRHLEPEILNLFSETIPPYRQHRQKEGQWSYFESSITRPASFYETLIAEAHDTFDSEKEIKIASTIIGNLEDNGLFTTALSEIAHTTGTSVQEVEAVLETIKHTFTPVGIGAKDLRECALIQLERKGQQDTVSYQIIAHHFDDLVHNRLPKIAKALKLSLEDLQHTIDTSISKLTMHPAFHHESEADAYIVPDVVLTDRLDELSIIVNEGPFPRLHFNARYVDMLEHGGLDKETRLYLNKKLISARWLMHTIHARHETLYRVTEALVKRQADYLTTSEGTLRPMTMQEIALDLEISESTVSRTVSNKYISTPRGTLSLRALFTGSIHTSTGDEVSTATVKEMVAKLIQNEDKKHPFTDEKLADLLQEQGVDCARRTVAKYRKELGLGRASQRKRYTSD